MAAIYPYRWMSQFAGEKAMKVARAEWWQALRKFSGDDIDRGLSVCRMSGGEFPPSIPAFVKMCQPTPEEFGIIDEERAYEQWVKNGYTSIIIDNTDRRLDKFAMSTMWAREHKKEFIRQYRICVEDYIRAEVPSRYQILPGISGGKLETSGAELCIGTTEDSIALK